MRAKETKIIAAMYFVCGALHTVALIKLKPMIKELYAGVKIEYSSTCLLLMRSQSYVWFIFYAFCGLALLHFGKNAKGPWLNIAFGIFLLLSFLIWFLSFMGLLFLHVRFVD